MITATEIEKNVNIFAFFSAALMVLASPGAGLAAESQSPVLDVPRDAQDIEPDNNEWANATKLQSGDVVNGSLLMNPLTDVLDFFEINVSFGMVVWATLYLKDYDQNRSDNYTYGVLIEGAYALLDSFTVNRTVTRKIVQFHPTNNRVKILIYAPTGWEAPARYRLNVTIETMPEVSYIGGKVSGFLECNPGPSSDWFKINPPPINNTLYTLTLETPTTGWMNMSVATAWPVDKSLWELNMTAVIGNGNKGYASFIGLGGDYYVTVSVHSGYGYYNLSLTQLGAPPDNDNLPQNATLIKTASPTGPYSIATGVDPIDWYVVNMISDRPVRSALLTIVSPDPAGYLYFEACDKDLKLLASDYSSNISKVLFDIRVDYKGPVFFAVRAYSCDAWYKLTIDLPNDPPAFKGGIPVITLDEDTSDNSLVLSDYFTDEEGQTLAYSVLGSSYHCKPTVDRTTGRVTFNPEPNWWGEEKVRFQAKDDGPRNLTTECNTTVVVRSVNDLPRVLRTIDDIIMYEENAWRSEPVNLLFSDSDDILDNLSFKCKVVDSSAHPPAGILPVSYNSQDRIFVAGPARLIFGDFTIELNCSDNRPGTVPASIRFNISVVHVNHDPSRNTSMPDPIRISILEGDEGKQFPVDDMFRDPDLPTDYGGDVLSYSVSRPQKISASIENGHILTLGAKNEEVQPGNTLFETLKVTARDKAGGTATVNVAVTVMPVNDPPVIQTFQPADDVVMVNEGGRVTFSGTVVDPDTESSRITYSWYLDGTKDTKSKGPTFAYAPAFDEGDSAHIVLVEVSDGEFNATMQWNITVKNVNRAPSGYITAPSNFTKYKKGQMISFTATGSDPDGDNLTYIWRDERGVELGRGAAFATDKLPAGTHKIRLEVSDGTLTASQEVTVIVMAPAAPAKSPGFEAAVLALAAGLALLLAVRKRRN